MSAEAARSTTPSPPTIVRAGSLDSAARRSFLADVVIEHGPRDLLGRLFLLADTALREKGLFVSYCDFAELKAVNIANRDSWAPMVTIFDPDVSDATAQTGFALVGRDANGRAVWTHAARNISLGSKTLKDEVESLALFYRDPAASAWPGEAAICTAPIAARTRGDVACIGAAWLHPEWRGRGVQELTRPIQRAMTLTRWTTSLFFTFMSSKLIKAGYAASSNLHIDMDVQLINTPVIRGGTYHGGIAWISRDEQVAELDDYVRYLSGLRDAKVDGGALERAGDKKLSV